MLLLYIKSDFIRSFIKKWLMDEQYMVELKDYMGLNNHASHDRM